MANRSLYNLAHTNDDAVIVYFTDKDDNTRRQGMVFDDGGVRVEYSPGKIPLYIQKICVAFLTSDPFEQMRGCTYAGQSIKLGRG